MSCRPNWLFPVSFPSFCSQSGGPSGGSGIRTATVDCRPGKNNMIRQTFWGAIGARVGLLRSKDRGGGAMRSDGYTSTIAWLWQEGL